MEKIFFQLYSTGIGIEVFSFAQFTILRLLAGKNGWFRVRVPQHGVSGFFAIACRYPSSLCPKCRNKTIRYISRKKKKKLTHRQVLMRTISSSILGIRFTSVRTRIAGETVVVLANGYFNTFAYNIR